MEKPINLENKGYGNLGWGSPRDLAKAHRSKELEWAKDAQNRMNTSLMVILGHWN